MKAAKMIFSNQETEYSNNYLSAALLLFAHLVQFEIQELKII